MIHMILIPHCDNICKLKSSVGLNNDRAIACSVGFERLIIVRNVDSFEAKAAIVSSELGVHWLADR